MKKKWNILLMVGLLVFISIFLSACKESDEKNVQPDLQENVISDQPIEYDGDYVEDSETIDEESSEGTLDGHEEESVPDESGDTEPIEEEYSE